MDKEHKRYTTRSSAHRAARNACRKALDAPRYMAYEGPDYEIHPDSGPFGLGCDRYGGSHYYFKLRGPAADAARETTDV